MATESSFIFEIIEVLVIFLYIFTLLGGFCQLFHRFGKIFNFTFFFNKLSTSAGPLARVRGYPLSQTLFFALIDR